MAFACCLASYCPASSCLRLCASFAIGGCWSLSDVVLVSRLTASTKSQSPRNISRSIDPRPPSPQTRQLKTSFLGLTAKRSSPAPHTGQAPTNSPLDLRNCAPYACATAIMSLARALSTNASHSSRLSRADIIPRPPPHATAPHWDHRYSAATLVISATWP